MSNGSGDFGFGKSNVLSEMQKCLVFERKLEIFVRINEWRVENKRLGILSDLTDTWTPEQVNVF